MRRWGIALTTASCNPFILPQRTAEAGFDKARGDSIDLDIILRQFAGQDFGKHEHGRFTDRIDAHHRLGFFSGHRAHIDHLALPARFHNWRTGSARRGSSPSH